MDLRQNTKDLVTASINDLVSRYNQIPHGRCCTDRSPQKTRSHPTCIKRSNWRPVSIGRRPLVCNTASFYAQTRVKENSHLWRVDP